MVRENRIKDYTFQAIAGDATTITQYTNHVLNGELLRVNSFANFTGSVILKESGTGLQFCNYSVTSGTNTWNNFNFSTTTGSFCINNNLSLTVGSLASGTAVVFGPLQIFYR